MDNHSRTVSVLAELSELSKSELTTIALVIELWLRARDERTIREIAKRAEDTAAAKRREKRAELKIVKQSTSA